jgi:hypothetical protein
MLRWAAGLYSMYSFSTPSESLLVGHPVPTTMAQHQQHADLGATWGWSCSLWHAMSVTSASNMCVVWWWWGGGGRGWQFVSALLRCVVAETVNAVTLMSGYKTGGCALKIMDATHLQRLQ